MNRLVLSRAWPIGLPIWLAVGLLGVVGLAIAALIADRDSWAVAATALATALLAVFTAQLYSAAIATLRAESRPLLVEVKPYAPPPADLAIRWGPDKRDPARASQRPYYNIEFPDDHSVPEWDGRRPYVEAKAGGPLRVSVIVRNVGRGLALIKADDIAFEHVGRPVIAKRRVRYPRLPVGESTRINLVGAGTLAEDPETIKLVIPYTDLSEKHQEWAHVTLDYKETSAWTQDESGHAWELTEIRYHTKGVTLLQ